MVLRASWRRWTLILVGSLIFAIVGGRMFANGDMTGLWLIGIFGLNTVVAIAALIKRGSLTLNDDGFVVQNLGRSTSWKWDQIAAFGVVSSILPARVNKMVGMNFTPEHRSTASGISQAVAGYDGALPDTYGLKAEDLAALLQQRLLESRSKRSTPRI